MANYLIGDMIHDTRVEQGCSQEELSSGICSPSSLSRIENNLQVPGKRMFDALMQRLGVPESIYSVYISREEMELYRLTQQLTWKIENMDFDGVRELISRLEERISSRHVIERQYLLYARSVLKKWQGEDPEMVFSLLLESIHITMPGFARAVPVHGRLLTFQEITILNSIASVYFDTGLGKEGLDLLYCLKEYLEHHVIDEEERAKKYPMILYNIACRIGEEDKNFMETYGLCSLAIDYCTGHNNLAVLPYLLGKKACAAVELARTEESKKLFIQAAELFEIMKKDGEAKRVRNEAALRYGIRLEEL